jgi:hypothetical protein
MMTDICPSTPTIAISTMWSSSPPIPGTRSSPCEIRNRSPDFVDIDPAYSKVPRPRTCFVFKHMPDWDIETKYYSKTNGQMEWRCKYCPKRYAINGGTRCMKLHLKSVHEITEDSLRNERSKKRQISIEDALATGASNPQKRRRFDSEDSGSEHSTINPDQLEVLYVNFVTSCNLPLRLVECPSFRNLLTYLNGSIDTWLPEDHHTIRTWIMRQYEFQKLQIKERLQTALSCVHLSIDLWSSGNGLALIGIIAHILNPNGELEEFLISLKEVKGQHNGENLSRYVLQAINDYEIASKLGYLQMDNASNNDSMIREISVGT